MAFVSRIQILQLLFVSSLFASCICVENSEPGTVGEGGDDGTVVVAPPPHSDTTLPPFIYTTLTFRQTPARLPDTTRYVHTPGIGQNTVVTNIPYRTNRPSTIFPPDLTDDGSNEIDIDDPFNGGNSFLRKDTYSSMAILTTLVLVSLLIQRLLRNM